MDAPRDWTTGPAKWAAVLVLGSASIAGIAWSAATRTRTPSDSAATPSEVPVTETRPAAEARATRSTPGRLIDLNTATIAELELLPGVGPATASRITDYRQKNGPFTSVEQLDSVKGIGPRTMERLRPLVTVTPAPDAH